MAPAKHEETEARMGLEKPGDVHGGSDSGRSTRAGTA